MNHCSWKCSYTVQISRKHLCVHTIIELDQCLPLLIAKYHRLFISLSHPGNMRLLTAIFNRLTSFLGSICRLWCATHMLGYAEAVNTARHKSLIDLLKPQATAESNSNDRTSGHHTDALLWATVYIFLFFTRPFLFPNTLYCTHLLSQTLPISCHHTLTLFSTCSHFLFHKLSLGSGIPIFHPFSLFLTFCSFVLPLFWHFTVFLTISPPLSVFSINLFLQSSVSSSFILFLICLIFLPLIIN